VLLSYENLRKHRRLMHQQPDVGHAERVAQPTLTEDGRRAPALRFGDPRVMALTGALCLNLFATTGITNKSLRALTTRLLGTSYSTSQMT
jgi:hypothetical protein